MTERRRFNSRERFALYAAAGGRCERCGRQLGPDWHADHVHPYSQSGPTDVINGAALCRDCNLSKGATVTDPRYAWQETAIADFVKADYDFLVTACPGAGKTDMALKAARILIDRDVIDQVIVIVPRFALKKQWHERGQMYGLDVTGTFKNSSTGHGAKHGYITTYQAVASNWEFHRHQLARRRTLVVFDEIHHCGDKDNTTWGPAIRKAFDAAHRRLLLSGTPFRTDRSSIPFVTYGPDGFAEAHNRPPVTYGRAVRDGMCRAIQFEVLDGTAIYKKGGVSFNVGVGDVDDSNRGIVLGELYNSASQWFAGAFTLADEALDEVRKDMPDAGGLILAERVSRAYEYVKIVQDATGETPLVVVSKGEDDQEVDPSTPSPSDLIDQFRDSKDKWMIAVAMVSEGVDIPRLAVGLWGSRVMTEQWTRQIVGRFVRKRDDTDPTVARLFIPNVPELVGWSETIEEEATVALAERTEALREAYEQLRLELEAIVSLGTSTAERTETIHRGEHYSDAELRVATDALRNLGITAISAIDAVKLARAMGIIIDSESMPDDEPKMSGDRLRADLKATVNAEIRKRYYWWERQFPFGKIWTALYMASGVRAVEAATIDELEQMLRILSTWRDPADAGLG